MKEGLRTSVFKTLWKGNAKAEGSKEFLRTGERRRKKKKTNKNKAKPFVSSTTTTTVGN
jgi:hypothetical protein